MTLYDIPEPEQTTRTVQLGPPDPKVEATLKHLSKGWLPVSPKLLATIRSALKAENKKPRQAVIDCVKSDPGLYVYAARSMQQVTSEVTVHDPIAELQTLEDEKLSAMFNTTAASISSHDLTKMSKSQALRLQHTLVSSTAAEQIAKFASLPSNLAFTLSTFLELGLNLVAWNYPHIYTRYMARLRTGNTQAVAELRAVLGLTPIEIAIRLASRWKLPQEVRASLTAIEATRKTPQSLSLDSLNDIVQLSSIYAESRNGDNSEAQHALWAQVEAGPAKLLPSGFFIQIDLAVRNTLAQYVETSSVTSSLPLAPRPPTNSSFHDQSPGQQLLESNLALKHAGTEVRTRFARPYAHITPGKISLPAIRILSNETIPASGFPRGCLFLLSTDNRKLTPALRIGEFPLSRYTGFGRDVDRGILASPFSSTPFKSEGIGIADLPTHHIASGLDNDRYLGLLYLEIRDDSNPELATQLILIFKAIRQALNDALGVRAISVESQ